MKTSNEDRTANAPGVGFSDWLGQSARCSWCGGMPHKMRDCPACANTKEELEKHIKRLNKALDDIQDILPWGTAEAEAMRQIAIKALEWRPTDCTNKQADR